MKKIFAMFLCFLMIISLLGCDGTATPDGTDGTGSANATGTQAALSAGYAKEDITPTGNVSLSGYGADADITSGGVMDYIYVTCIAIADAEGDTVLFYTCDVGGTDNQIANKIKKKVSKETGIPVENMQFSATHTHSAPSMANNSALVDKAVKAGIDAVADLTPAEMYIGTAKTESLNFVRHYETADGKFIGDNYGIHSTATIIGHETEADNEMRLIKFAREGDKKDIVMMNWQAHPNQTGFYHMVSSDFIGPCRDKMEESLDCLFAYYQGAAGNLNGRSYLSAENRTQDVDHRDHGGALASFAIKAMDSLKKAEGGDISVKVETYTGKVRQTDPEFAAMVSTFMSVYQATGSREKACEATGGIVNSTYAIKAMEGRSNAGETMDVEIRAISFGDVAFVTAPYEMFDTNGMYIRENSPYDMTFVMAYCNDGKGYIPSALAFEHGCYERDNGFFAAGTGEELADLYVSMLEELHGE